MSKNLHDIQLALCEHIVNLCETYNHGIAHSFPVGGKRCTYARIIGSVQAAKTCGFYIALAKLPYSDVFTAVCVWETEYDTRITKSVRAYDLTGVQQTAAQAAKNGRTWIYGTNPKGTWGNISWSVGVNTANLAYTGLCVDPGNSMKETLNSLYGTAAAELHPEYFDTDSVTGGAEQ